MEENIIQITWEELKELRDNSKLIPGTSYRITDYITTTSQENTWSAGHQFDIIITASDVNKLSEEAKAIKNQNDDYFTMVNANLELWKIWYCIDNDSNRFLWADDNGKGVIYRMIDEWGNDCPYDFKNILFTRYKITECQKSPGLVGLYSTNIIDDIIVDISNPYYVYTFCLIDANTKISYDLSFSKTYNNVFKNSYKTKSTLPDNVLIIDTDNCPSDELFYGFYDNTFESGVQLNTFGNNCIGNKLDYNCSKNTFGYNVYANIFDTFCKNNIIGNNFNNNTFGDKCQSNIFKDDCYCNMLGDSCINNVFNNNCHNNILEDECTLNTLEDNCFNIIIDIKTVYKTFSSGTNNTPIIKNEDISDDVGYNPDDDIVKI